VGAAGEAASPAARATSRAARPLLLLAAPLLSRGLSWAGMHRLVLQLAAAAGGCARAGLRAARVAGAL
jgi:hypothetical protein